MCDGFYMYVSDLLEMRLDDIIDLLVDRLDDSNDINVKFNLNDIHVNSEEYCLRVCLCKTD